jgi:alginate O-acetyltransferase complex protein AlgI
MLVAAIVAAERLTGREPVGLRMLAICGALLFGFKAVVGAVHLAAGGAPLSPGRWLAFALGWPGMNPETFAAPRAPHPDGADLVRRGILRLTTGALLVLAARFVWIISARPALAAAPLLAGLSLILHFGLFTFLAGLWRLFGIPCMAPFEAPFLAASLSDFWAHRWNRPFSELVQLAIYRPVASLAGRGGGLFAGFLLSGFLHELAISVPARAGYGRPLAYFALQGALVLLEKRRLARGLPPPGRALTILAFALPVPLLLIPEFLRGAIWPIIGMD